MFFLNILQLWTKNMMQNCLCFSPEEIEEMDDKRMVEGCFCPFGTKPFSPAVDVCVSTCGKISALFYLLNFFNQCEIL